LVQLDEATTKLINKGVRLTEVLKQDKYKPMNVLHQVFVIGLGVFDYYENISTEDVSPYQESMLNIFTIINFFKPYHSTLYSQVDPILFFKILNSYLIGLSNNFNVLANSFRKNLSLYFK